MPPVLFGAVLFLSKAIGMLTEVPSPTWRPMPVPMPKTDGHAGCAGGAGAECGREKNEGD